LSWPDSGRCAADDRANLQARRNCSPSRSNHFPHTHISRPPHSRYNRDEIIYSTNFLNLPLRSKVTVACTWHYTAPTAWPVKMRLSQSTVIRGCEMAWTSERSWTEIQYQIQASTRLSVSLDHRLLRGCILLSIPSMIAAHA